MSNNLQNITLRVWRQAGPNEKGHFEEHKIASITDEASFLEMLDILNDELVHAGKEAIVFDHDCREGICGTCSLMIDGNAHGPQKGTATCDEGGPPLNRLVDTVLVNPSFYVGSTRGRDDGYRINLSVGVGVHSNTVLVALWRGKEKGGRQLILLCDGGKTGAAVHCDWSVEGDNFLEPIFLQFYKPTTSRHQVLTTFFG